MVDPSASSRGHRSDGDHAGVEVSGSGGPNDIPVDKRPTYPGYPY